MNPSAAYSTAEARKLLGGIGHTKLYQLIGEGQLRARKLSGRTVILGSDIADFLARLPDATACGAVRSQKSAA